jgi:hypothetical protein
MDVIEIVGWVGSAVLVVSLLQTRVVRLRLVNLVGCLILLGYNWVIEVWPMVGLNVVLALINVVYLWRMVSTRHDDGSYTVIEVEPDDRYLQHVLSVHGADIARHNPGFTHDPASEQGAFLVVRGDETVGVVLVRDAGAGVAQVVLDYVTPRFRDLSPGEFVYRTSEVFTSRGFRRVLTPAGMVSPYYAHLGFQQEGDQWALDLDPAGGSTGEAAAR